MNWYVEFPTYRYVEDVKELARKNGLKIIDAKFQGENKQCDKAPKLTLKKEFEVKTEQEKKPRDILIERALELEVEFDSNISNKDLKALVDAKEAEQK